MSMSGIRGLALIETPPEKRRPIQTYVMPESVNIIKDAIYKELSRNGQVFMLYNSVEKIDNKLEEIHKLVPEANIRYAHGRMTKVELENIMIDFTNHKFDILLCTTIIETGIDIPNVNTYHSYIKLGVELVVVIELVMLTLCIIAEKNLMIWQLKDLIL